MPSLRDDQANQRQACSSSIGWSLRSHAVGDVRTSLSCLVVQHRAPAPGLRTLPNDAPSEENGPSGQVSWNKAPQRRPSIFSAGSSLTGNSPLRRHDLHGLGRRSINDLGIVPSLGDMTCMVWSAAPSTTRKFLPPPVSTSLHQRPVNSYVVRRHDLYALGCRYRRSKFG